MKGFGDPRDVMYLRLSCTRAGGARCKGYFPLFQEAGQV
jgi:hypothetical protein